MDPECILKSCAFMVLLPLPKNIGNVQNSFVETSKIDLLKHRKLFC